MGATAPEAVEGTSVVVLMVRDAFANYVVQTTLDVVADPAEKHKLMEELSTHSTELVGHFENFSRISGGASDCLPLHFSHYQEKLHFRETHCDETGVVVFKGQHSMRCPIICYRTAVVY